MANAFLSHPVKRHPLFHSKNKARCGRLRRNRSKQKDFGERPSVIKRVSRGEKGKVHSYSELQRQEKTRGSINAYIHPPSCEVVSYNMYFSAWRNRHVKRVGIFSGRIKRFFGSVFHVRSLCFQGSCNDTNDWPNCSTVQHVRSHHQDFTAIAATVFEV